jgi:hypothetical protein
MPGRVLVVVLPLLPVIQIFVALVYLDANSISEITGKYLSFVQQQFKAAESGMPGLLMISPAERIFFSE